MTDNVKNSLVSNIIAGMSSMTLLAFVLLLSLYLFPRLTISLIAVLTLICLCRYLPRFRRAA